MGDGCTPRSWDWKEVGVLFTSRRGSEKWGLTPLVSFMSILGPSSPVRFTRPNTSLPVSWGALYELVTVYPTFPIIFVIIGGSFATCLLDIHDLGFFVLHNIDSEVFLLYVVHFVLQPFHDFAIWLRYPFSSWPNTFFARKIIRVFSFLQIAGRTLFATSRRVRYKRVLYLFTDHDFIGVPLAQVHLFNVSVHWITNQRVYKRRYIIWSGISQYWPAWILSRKNHVGKHFQKNQSGSHFPKSCSHQCEYLIIRDIQCWHRLTNKA